jgi:hypothetical protein
MSANYLKTFRKAVQKSPECDKSDISDKSPSYKNTVSENLLSHKTLMSPVGDRKKPFADDFATLERCRPDYVDHARWQQAVEDGRRLLATWGEQAAALGWSGEELFGLHEPPSNPHPSYRRLARYDCTGLVWLLSGNHVVALTDNTASIKHRSGSMTVYRKHNKPALGPLGDSLDDFA